MTTRLRRLVTAPASAVVVPVLAVSAIAVWAISPRFSITAPSLIDDWDALVSAPATMHDLVRLHYPAGARFFPSWILWNWLQWRLPGAPENMLGPNLLGVARIILLVAGLTAASWFLVPTRGRLERAVLSVLPALAVVSIPEFGEDLARFGPQEPALIGAMSLGGALLFLGGRLLAHGSRGKAALVCVALGFLAWCYGVLQKETSVCVLFVLLLAIPVRGSVLRRFDARQWKILGRLAGLALLPVLLMVYEDAKIDSNGSLVYGSHVKGVGGTDDVFFRALQEMGDALHSNTGYVVAGVALAGVAVSLMQRRIDWPAVMIILLAAASLEMSVQTNIFASRYYLPSVALLAVAAARAVSALPWSYARLPAIAVSTAVLLAFVPSTRSNVRDWAHGDQLGADLVSAVRAKTDGGCRLTITGVDEERTQSIAALVAYGYGPKRCTGLDRYVLLGPSATASPDQSCVPGKARELDEWRVSNAEPITFVRCA